MLLYCTVLCIVLCFCGFVLVIFVALFPSFFPYSILCVFVTFVQSFLSCFRLFCIVVHSCTMVVHTTTYDQVLHDKPQGTGNVRGLHGGVHIKTV